MNPLFVLPGALAERATFLAEALKNSVTLGVAQFCTKPGLTFGIRSEGFDAFVHQLAVLTRAAPAGTMLTPAICRSYEAAVQRLCGIDGVSTSRTATAWVEPQAVPALFVTEAADSSGIVKSAKKCSGHRQWSCAASRAKSSRPSRNSSKAS